MTEEEMATAITQMRANDDGYEERWRETWAQTGTKAEPSMRGRGWRRCGPQRLLCSTFPQHLPTVRHPPALKADSNLLRSRHTAVDQTEERNIATQIAFGGADRSAQ